MANEELYVATGEITVHYDTGGSDAISAVLSPGDPIEMDRLPDYQRELIEAGEADYVEKMSAADQQKLKEERGLAADTQERVAQGGDGTTVKQTKSTRQQKPARTDQSRTKAQKKGLEGANE